MHIADAPDRLAGYIGGGVFQTFGGSYVTGNKIGTGIFFIGSMFSGKGEIVALGKVDDIAKLLEVAFKAGKGNITGVGRAFQKHSVREGTAFIGEITGNAGKNTEQGAKYLKEIITNPKAVSQVKDTKAYGKVLDIKLPDGMGARWSSDGKEFIGFLEPLKKK